MNYKLYIIWICLLVISISPACAIEIEQDSYANTQYFTPGNDIESNTIPSPIENVNKTNVTKNTYAENRNKIDFFLGFLEISGAIALGIFDLKEIAHSMFRLANNGIYRYHVNVPGALYAGDLVEMAAQAIILTIITAVIFYDGITRVHNYSHSPA